MRRYPHAVIFCAGGAFIPRKTQSRFFFLSIYHAKKQPTTVIASGIHQTQSPGIRHSPMFMPKKPNTIFGMVMMMVRMVRTFMMMLRLFETTDA